jgi:plastocyanin
MKGMRLLVVLLSGLVLIGAAVACGGDDANNTSGNTPVATATRAPTNVPLTTAPALGSPSAPLAPVPTPTPSAPAPSPPTTAPPPPPPTTAPPPPPPAAQPPEAINVTIRNFTFGPAAINAVVGQAVTLNVMNSDSAPHTLTLTGGGSTGTIAGGQRGMVTFTRTAPGPVQFFCEIHGAARMSGTVNVTS